MGSPTFFVCRVVCDSVYGMRETRNRVELFFNSATVRLVPSKQIEPLCTIGGASNADI